MSCVDCTVYRMRLYTKNVKCNFLLTEGGRVQEHHGVTSTYQYNITAKQELQQVITKVLILFKRVFSDLGLKVCLFLFFIIIILF